jgi:SHS2 domain-containing protein
LSASFKILEHPSDLGIEAIGSSMQQVFRNAAFGLMSVIAGPSKIKLLEKHQIILTANDLESLLVRWLSEVLYFYDAEKFLTGEIEFVTLNDSQLKATIVGETYKPALHTLKLDVKAVTYHHLSIVNRRGKYTAKVFLDI